MVFMVFVLQKTPVRCLFVWQNTHCSLHIRSAALSCEIRIDGLEGSVGPDDVTVGDC